MARATSVISAPTFSANTENSLMKLILVARKAFAAYFVNSALVAVVVMRGGRSYRSGLGVPGGGSNVCSRMGAYNSRSTPAGNGSSQPMTMRSG